MAKGISLHIGIDRVNRSAYDGKWEGRLGACEADAGAMAAIANNLPGGLRYYRSDVLLTPRATIENVTSKIEQAAYDCDSGDTFFLTCSSHGGQMDDGNSDEIDKKDETWVLYDGELVDDQLNNLWVRFDPGVNIIMLSDTCHAETIAKAVVFDTEFSRQKRFRKRLLPDFVAESTYQRNKVYYDNIQSNPVVSKDDIKASMLVLAACADHLSAYEGPFFGIFTGRVIDIWRNGAFTGTYSEFFTALTEIMKTDNQTPTWRAYGPERVQYKTPFVF